jgi:hypothetical protein
MKYGNSLTEANEKALSVLILSAFGLYNRVDNVPIPIQKPIP